MQRGAQAAGILTVLSVLLLTPQLIWGQGDTHSGVYNILWTQQVAEGLQRGELYPRWFPESFGGLGSPTFYFYPPLVFLLSGVMKVAGLATARAVTVATLVLLIASGGAMYAWLRHCGTRPLLGACLYILAPYHLIDIVDRGALAEAAAYVWVPLITLGLATLTGRRGVLLLAVAYAGLILTHLPAAILVTLFLIAPIALWRCWRTPAVIAPGLLAAALGIMLSAAYWLPALTLQAHISTELLWGGHYAPSAWFDWRRLGISHLAFYLVLPVALMILAAPARSIWSAVTILAGLAAIGLIPFIWDLPLLATTQFPFRLLMVVEFAALTAVLASPPKGLTLSAGRLLMAAPVTIAIAALVRVPLHPIDEAAILRARPDAPEYLPRGLPAPGVSGRQRIADVTAYATLPRGQSYVATRAGPVTLGHAAFPIWRVTRDGREVTSTGPLISFHARPGVYRLERRTLWQEAWGFGISGAGLLGLAVLALSARRRNQVA